MNKQLIKIDDTIKWLEANVSEDSCVLIMAMAEETEPKREESDEASDESADADSYARKVELKTFIEGYDEDLSIMLAKKMVLIPLFSEIFTDALSKLNISIDLDSFDKWRAKNKYDNHFDVLDINEDSVKPIEGDIQEYVKVMQEFCVWMNAKPSRNLTLLAFADDDLNSEKTTFAMGFPPDISIMLSKEFADNKGFCEVVESSIYAKEKGATFEEFKEWKKSIKK